MLEFLPAYGLLELRAYTFQYNISASPKSVGKTETGSPFVIIDVDNNNIDMCDAGPTDRPVKTQFQKIRFRA